MRLLRAAVVVPWAEVLASPGTWDVPARPQGWGADSGLRAGLVPCDADPTVPDCQGDTKEVPLPDSGAQPGPHLQVERTVVSSWVGEREAWTELLGPWASRLLGRTHPSWAVRVDRRHGWKRALGFRLSAVAGFWIWRHKCTTKKRPFLLWGGFDKGLSCLHEPRTPGRIKSTEQKS